MHMRYITIQIGEEDDKGTVTLTASGRQFLTAFLLKQIRDCENGRIGAMAMKRSGTAAWADGQEVYFRNAASKLGQIMLACIADKLKLKEQLETVTQWGDDAQLPYSWMRDVIDANEPEQADGTGRPDPSGSRRVGDGVPQPARKDCKRKPKTVKRKTDKRNA